MVLEVWSILLFPPASLMTTNSSSERKLAPETRLDIFFSTLHCPSSDWKASHNSCGSIGILAIVSGKGKLAGLNQERKRESERVSEWKKKESKNACSIAMICLLWFLHLVTSFLKRKKGQLGRIYNSKKKKARPGL